MDNDSPDDTVERVLAAGSAIELIRTGRNGGFSAGVNAGIAAAPGGDVLVLNADIRLRPGSVRRLREALAVPGTGIAVPRLLGADGELQLSLRRRPTVLRAVERRRSAGSERAATRHWGELVVDPRAYERPGTPDWATGAAWLVSRDCLDAVGPLDERYFLYSEETEDMLRIRDLGFTIRYEPEAVAVHLGGEQANSSPLWTLAAANRVRLHRQRYGRPRAVLMRLAVALNEALRAVTRGRRAGQRHRAALRELATMAEWPTPPGGPAIAAGLRPSSPPRTEWYHNRAHSDFQLMRAPRGIAQGADRQQHRHAHAAARPLHLRAAAHGPGSWQRTGQVRPAGGARPVGDVAAPAPPVRLAPGPRAERLAGQDAGPGGLPGLGLKVPEIVVTIPTAWDVVRPMRRRALIFNRSDRHSAFPESDTGTIETLERDLLERADHVVYASRGLMAEERPLAGYAGPLPRPRGRPGALQPRPGRPDPDLRASRGQDRLLRRLWTTSWWTSTCWNGSRWACPRRRSCSSATRTGRSSGSRKHPNVHWLGLRPYSVIPAYGSGFDVAIMPWLDNEWIKHANPIKLKEFLALGLPVVSTEFDELAHYAGRVRTATTPEQFIEAIRLCLAEGGPQSPETLRGSLAGASWSARAADLMALAEQPPDLRR